MRPGQVLALCGRQLRKTKAQVDQDDVPAPTSEGKQRNAEGVAEAREQRQRQEVQQPEYGDEHAAEHSRSFVGTGKCAV